METSPTVHGSYQVDLAFVSEIHSFTRESICEFQKARHICEWVLPVRFGPRAIP